MSFHRYCSSRGGARYICLGLGYPDCFFQKIIVNKRSTMLMRSYNNHGERCRKNSCNIGT